MYACVFDPICNFKIPITDSNKYCNKMQGLNPQPSDYETDTKRQHVLVLL